MSYRLNTSVKPLIWVDCKFRNFSNSRIEIQVRARAQFKSRSHANDIDIIIPVPDDADSPKFKSSLGNVKWKPELSAVVWHLKKLVGGKEVTMTAELSLPSVRGDDGAAVTSGEVGLPRSSGFDNSATGANFNSSNKPISVKFTIPFLQHLVFRYDTSRLLNQSYNTLHIHG